MSQDSASIVKSAIPISQYVSRFTDTVKSVGNGKFKAACIAHGGDNKTAMSIDDKLGLWFCHSSECNGGSIIDLWMKMNDSTDFGDAVEHLASELNVTLPEYDGGSRVSTKRVLAAIKLVAEEAHDFLMNDDHEDAKAARSYLRRERKVKRDLMKEWTLGMLPSGREAIDVILDVCDDEDALVEAGILSRTKRDSLWAPMNGRLMFPVSDASKSFVGFSARVVPDVDHSMDGKFVNTRETSVYHKSKTLYGMHRVTPKTKRAIVVEGNLDIMGVMRAFNDPEVVALATCGTSLTSSHVDYLNQFESVTYLFDADHAGKKAAIKNLWCVNQLRDKAFTAYLPEGTDPWQMYSESREDELIRVVNSCLPVCTVAVQAQWQLLEHDEARLVDWVRNAAPKLSYTHHRTQIIADAALVTGKALAAFKRDLAVPVDINTRRTGSAAIDMMSDSTKSFCSILLNLDDDTRGGILSSFSPWTSKVEETVKNWLPASTDMDLQIIRKIVMGAEDKGSENRVDLAIAELMNSVDQEGTNADVSMFLRSLAKQMLSEVSGMKKVNKSSAQQIKLLRRSMNASRVVAHQHSVFGFLMDMTVDIDRQKRSLAKQVA